MATTEELTCVGKLPGDCHQLRPLVRKDSTMLYTQVSPRQGASSAYQMTQAKPAMFGKETTRTGSKVSCDYLSLAILGKKWEL